jgi:hypothetical protein
MSFENLVYIIYPRGTPPEVTRMMDAAIRDAKLAIYEELKAKTFTSTDYLSRLKSILAAKMAGLPTKVRVAIAEKIAAGTSETALADALAIRSPATEEFKTVRLPHFERLADPEITIRPEIPVGGVYFAPGMYKTFGKWGSTALVGGGTAALTFFPLIFAGVDWKLALIAAIITGGFAGIVTYITMAGVEAGVPVSAKRSATP